MGIIINMKLVSAICLIGATQAVKLPDYYGDERFGGVWNWHIQDDERIGAPSTFSSDTMVAFPGYADAGFMSQTEYGTRLGKFGTYKTAAINMDGVGGAAPVTPAARDGFTQSGYQRRDGELAIRHL